MAVDALPLALVEQLVASFEPFLPAGASITLKGRMLDVAHVGGGGWFGEPLGSLPWPPMPQGLKWRLAVQSVYETVARGLGASGRAQQSGDPFRLLWPVADARVHVEVSGQTIRAEFRRPDGTSALVMPSVEWSGPRTEQADRAAFLKAEPDAPTLHFGPSSHAP